MESLGNREEDFPIWASDSQTKKKGMGGQRKEKGKGGFGGVTLKLETSVYLFHSSAIKKKKKEGERKKKEGFVKIYKFRGRGKRNSIRLAQRPVSLVKGTD